MTYRPRNKDWKWDEATHSLVPVKQASKNNKPKAPTANGYKPVARGPPAAAGIPWGYEMINGVLVFKGKNAKPPEKQPVELPRKQPTEALMLQVDRLRKQGFILPDLSVIEKVFNDGTWVDTRGLVHEPEGRYNTKKPAPVEPRQKPVEKPVEKQPEAFKAVGAKTAKGEPIDMSVLIEINDALKTLAKYGLTLAKREQ